MSNPYGGTWSPHSIDPTTALDCYQCGTVRAFVTLLTLGGAYCRCVDCGHIWFADLDWLKAQQMIPSADTRKLAQVRDADVLEEDIPHLRADATRVADPAERPHGAQGRATTRMSK